MTLFVDTSVWSLAFRRDAELATPEVEALRKSLNGAEIIVSTGLILQELLQGFSGPRAAKDLIDRFSTIPFVSPDRDDHVSAAALRNQCRRGGVQVGTIDALVAQMCIRHELTLLTTDRDFQNMTAHCRLRLWKGG